MSLGFTAQSSIIPKKSKEIQVSQATKMAIKADLDQFLVKDGYGDQPKSKHSRKPITNSGVERRIEKDKESLPENLPKRSGEALSSKVKIYQKLERLACSLDKSLVDFALKDLEKSSSTFQEDRKAFYQGNLNNKESLSNNAQETYRERLHWEREMEYQLQHGTKQAKEKVLQAFHHHLSKEEKEELDKFLMEKDELKRIREKYQEQQEERCRKIKQLNLSSSESEQDKAE